MQGFSKKYCIFSYTLSLFMRHSMPAADRLCKQAIRCCALYFISAADTFLSLYSSFKRSFFLFNSL